MDEDQDEVEAAPPESDSDDDEDAALAQLQAQFPNAASDAHQAVLRHRLQGGLVEETLSTIDEAKLESYLQSDSTFNIPWILLDQLMVRPDTWLLRTPRYLGLCVTPSTRTLVICCAVLRPMAQGWSRENLDQLVQHITTTCKDSLVKLTIYNATVNNPSQPNVSTEQLHVLLNGIESLHQLHVQDIDGNTRSELSHIVTDTTLGIIAEKHQSIRSLSVPSSVTLAGLQRVLENCKDLQHLSMDSSEEAFRAAILQTPTLKSIRTFHHGTLGRCVWEIAMERHPQEPPFPLTAHIEVEDNLEEFRQVLEVFPNLSLKFHMIEDPDFYEALMEHRTELSKIKVDYSVPPPVAQLVQHFSTSLTSIYLNNYGVGDIIIDLAVIGYFCTNLKDLKAGGWLVADPEYTSMLDARHFAALEVLMLWEFRVLPPLLPSPLLVRLLGGKHLRVLNKEMLRVPDAVGVVLEEEARQVEGKALSSLQLLCFEPHGPSNATLRIIINAPNLLALYTYDLPPSIQAFLATIKPNLLILDDVPDNPIFL